MNPGRPLVSVHGPGTQFAVEIRQFAVEIRQFAVEIRQFTAQKDRSRLQNCSRNVGTVLDWEAGVPNLQRYVGRRIQSRQPKRSTSRNIERASIVSANLDLTNVFGSPGPSG